ncbi:hypothetical protein [Geodermatophilus sp. SYSU D00766]
MRTPGERGLLTEALGPVLVVGVAFGPLLEAFDVLGFGETWSWRQVLLSGVLVTAGAGLGTAVQLRLSAAARQRAAVGRAVAGGALPAGADGEWLERLTAERQRLLLSRTGVPSVLALAALLVAATTLLPRGPGDGALLLVVGLALAGVLGGARERRRLHSADRLQAELEERLTPSGR